jgi:2-isopropylmalate synthase
VRWARETLGRDAEIEFSAEDASRTEHEFLLQVYEAVVEAGASTVNIPDTVGYAIPPSSASSSRRSVDLVGSDATVSVHCHNDLGLATANTLAAVQAGARQVEVTVNGLGERAGNASLEEVVMALRTRPNQFAENIRRVADTEQITPPARLVSYLTGFAIQPNKAIVGANAFAHESGIHQDGVPQEPADLRDHDPAVRRAVRQHPLDRQAVRPQGPPGQAPRAGPRSRGGRARRDLPAAIALADTKKEVTDADLLALVEQRKSDVPRSIELTGRLEHQPRPAAATPSAASRSIAGEERSSEADRERPRQRAVRGRGQGRAPGLGWYPVLSEYEIKAVSGGEDAQGQVLVRCRRSSDEGPGALVVTGHGLSTNIIEASLEAYLVATNKLHGAEINGIAVAFVGRRTAEELP